MSETVGTTGATVGAATAADVAAAASAKAATDAAAATKAAADTAAAKAAADAASTGGNEENKFRRLHEAAETRAKAAETRAAELEAANTKRQQAEMGDLERAKAETADALTKAEKAEARAADLERQRLVESIAVEHGLTAEARELLAGADEASLRGNAAKLAAIMKQPAVAGTSTQPGRGSGASVDEQINSALKAGQTVKAIELKRQKAFGAN